ncbi:helix-turn-helix transcriptional regulator [Pseudomonas sp. C9]|uniref:helix-turn-helix transcriptional regulator n=1 Tax=Pseudomonas sp. C9 TaxID=1311337 RepID=UPI000984C9BC|nr:helix-turn-helix transcriptional regulator [Pseudomonas sp. C9]
MTDAKPFSERLLWARSEAGLTQKDLASKSGISLPQIVRYEAGRSKPRLGGALKLARVLGMDAYDLAPELKRTTKEIEIEFSDAEYQFLHDQSEVFGITVEELIRKLTMYGIKNNLNDPNIRQAIEEEEPGLIHRIETLNDDDDDPLESES